MASYPVAFRGHCTFGDDVDKIKFISKNLMIGASGDYSDFQKIYEHLEEKWRK